MTRRYVVSHPHAAAVATALAAALESRDMLAAYATGVAGAGGTWRRALLEAAARIRPEVRNRAVEIDPRRLRARWSVELLARMAAAVRAAPPYDAVFALHDAAVAAFPWPAEADAVYAYEDAALRTFRKARARGIACVWDLPLPHWPTLDRMRREEAARWPSAVQGAVPAEPEWKRRRKDEELALADVVSVASRFTQESLEAIGCTKPVVRVPYGFPVESFRPKTAPPAGPFTVLAVGTHDLRTGTPWLLEAWRRAAIADARLRLVGPLRLPEPFLATYRSTLEHVPHLPRADLEGEYQAADLLAFPTLGDGFGLVMQEAMCCGTPVLTTRCGGGPECITEGRDGWIVPERDVDGLVEALRRAAADREALHRMGRLARERAERWTWADAGEALARALALT